MSQTNAWGRPLEEVGRPRPSSWGWRTLEEARREVDSAETFRRRPAEWAVEMVAASPRDERTPTTVSAPLFEAGIPPTHDTLLSRIVNAPGGRSDHFTADQDRRMDAAFAQLQSLAEARLGLTREQAHGHARRVFLEMQHAASSANETTESFVRRLEQRASLYEAAQTFTPTLPKS